MKMTPLCFDMKVYYPHRLMISSIARLIICQTEGYHFLKCDVTFVWRLTYDTGFESCKEKEFLFNKKRKRAPTVPLTVKFVPMGHHPFSALSCVNAREYGHQTPNQGLDNHLNAILISITIKYI